MPRTKAPRRIKQERISNHQETLNPEFKEKLDKLSAMFEKYRQKTLRDMDMKFDSTLFKFKTVVMDSFSKNTKNSDKPIKDLINDDKTHEFITLCETANSFVNNTFIKSVRKGRRSKSCNRDEGYLTAGSCNSSTSRKSRSASHESRINRKATRSSSRSKNTQLNSGMYKTPHQKNEIKFVTPKIKPNTPQVILRRPKVGEVAISMEGSPLMVNSVLSTEESTVNIPLNDGRMIAIKPQRGIRMSQVPDFDSTTLRQLQLLRDNLNKLMKKE